MLKLTLDTNCIVNLLDYQSESATSVDEITEILRYALEGDVNVSVTTRLESDIETDKNEERKKEIIRRVSIFPVIGTVARFGFSKFDNGDVLTGEGHTVLEEEIKNIIFPGLKEDDARFHNKINDVDHIIGHKINGRDIFVTDDKQILKKAETLKSSLGIIVKSPKETVEYLNLQANKTVLVEEFYNKFVEYKKVVATIFSEIENPDNNDLAQYEELRKWFMRKYPSIKEGLINFKFQMVSIPVSGQRVFDQDNIMGIQNLNEKLLKLFEQRHPFNIPDMVAYQPYSSSYIDDNRKKSIMFNFLNSIEDLLLSYLGKIESE